MGGRLLHPQTTDLNERKILNVVEEMAIAAGTPVPPVYLLENEEGINAFAAGHAPNDAIIGVTRGCVQTLSRDELQGVIGHEFSHILNGDMRLNLRLMGVLFGILLIGLTGYILLRSTSGYGYRVRVNSRDDDRGRRNILPLIGLALYVIGYVGVFFANLIKAAVSRQREFLADASAVQFTRNPEGIAGALKKIGRLAGSAMHEPRAAEASHMFFGNIGGVGQLFGLLATHPPLVERIRRLDPSFDGDFSKVRLDAPAAEPTPIEPPRRQPRARSFSFNPAEAVARVGTIGAPQLLYAAGFLDDLAPAVSRQVRDPLGRSPRCWRCCWTRPTPYTLSSLRGSIVMPIRRSSARSKPYCPRSEGSPPRRVCHSWKWPSLRCGRCRRPRCENSWQRSRRWSRRTTSCPYLNTHCRGSCCATWSAIS